MRRKRWSRQGEQDDLVQHLKEDFGRLCRALGLQRFAYSLDLHDILRSLEKQSDLPQKSVEWLENGSSVLARYYEERFRQDGQDFHLNQASKWLRKADKPDMALKHAERSISSPSLKVRAFGYTTGAAAFLDMGNAAKAKEWAQHALRLEPNDEHASSVMQRLARYHDSSQRVSQLGPARAG